MKARIIFRCDGATHIGLGHVMRCIALADGLRKEGFSEITFLSKDYDKKILDKIRGNSFNVEIITRRAGLNEDLKKLVRMIQRNNRTIVITDSYAINTAYLKELKNAGAFLMCIDDLAQIHFPSDVVLNQNIYASEMNYSVETYTRLLLGANYVLLRGEFLKGYKVRPLRSKKVTSVVITMGGGTINNQTPKVLEALKNLSKEVNEKLVVCVIVGIGYQDHKQLHSLSSEQGLQIRMIDDPNNLPQLMAKADIAISGGGSTCYELAYLGIPTISISLADNQKRIGEKLDETGVSVYLGYYEDVSKDDIKKAMKNLIIDSIKRKEMSERGKILVDGRGVERVVRELKKLID